MTSLADILITFGIAAAPWGEILLAVPAGVLMGLHPLVALTVGIIGNMAPVLLLVAIGERWASRRSISAGSPRRLKAEAFFERYGAPGLALISPILTGVYIGVIVSLYFKVPRAKIVLWMGISIVAWGAAVTLLSYLGLELFR